MKSHFTSSSNNIISTKEENTGLVIEDAELVDCDGEFLLFLCIFFSLES